MLERLLAYRLRRLLLGYVRPADWPAPGRVLRRARPVTRGASFTALTLHRPLHIHTWSMPWHVQMLFARTGPRLTVRSVSMQLARVTPTASGRASTPDALADSAPAPVTEPLAVPRAATTTSRADLAPRHRAERWLAQQEQRRSLRTLLAHTGRERSVSAAAGAVAEDLAIPHTERRAPVETEFAAPRRILGRPVAATASDARATPVADISAALAATTPRYWTEPSAAPMAPAAPDLNRLTEQVLRNVDQRLVAARERLSQKAKG